MRNTYALSGTLNGRSVMFHKKFHSRDAAMDYMFKYYEYHLVFNPELDYTIEIDKHNINYVCTNGNVFNIRRKAA
ncbi:MAG: hypothetical protein MJ239_07625 [Bacilli bacterium]|nr:hypothetical protein [Bacilli bacterium]